MLTCPNCDENMTSNDDEFDDGITRHTIYTCTECGYSEQR